MIAGLAVSSIAWASGEEVAVAGMLRQEGIDAIELAPTTWRENPYDAPTHDVKALRARWEDRGFRIVSLQALLFGRPELRLFGTDTDRLALAGYLRKAIDFAQTLGAYALVFGSPRNRLRGDLATSAARPIARDFFRGIGEYAHDRGTAICLEANPPVYGCDFLTTTVEAIDLACDVDHPGVRVNGDLGGMLLAAEHVADSIGAAAPWLGHFHASEPQLAPLASAADHAKAGASLARVSYHRWVSIEMRRSQSGNDVDAVRRAIHLAKQAYFV